MESCREPNSVLDLARNSRLDRYPMDFPCYMIPAGQFGLNGGFPVGERHLPADTSV